MPKCVRFQNLMDNEIVEMFYHCVKNVDHKAIDFETVAQIVGLPDAAKAKARLARIMKAQEKDFPKNQQTAKVSKAGGTERHKEASGIPTPPVKKRRGGSVMKASEGKTEKDDNGTAENVHSAESEGDKKTKVEFDTGSIVAKAGSHESRDARIVSEFF